MCHFCIKMDADYAVKEEEEETTCKKRRRKRRRGECVGDGSREEAGDAELLNRYNQEGYLKGEMFRYRQVEPNDFGLSIDEVCVGWSRQQLMRWLTGLGLNTGMVGYSALDTS